MILSQNATDSLVFICDKRYTRANDFRLLIDKSIKSYQQRLMNAFTKEASLADDFYKAIFYEKGYDSADSSLKSIDGSNLKH